MTILKLIVISLLCITTLIGCVTEIDVFTESVPTFAVDGVLTNEPKIHKIRLSYSRVYGEPANYTLVENATVKIVDDLGHEELLVYDAYGTYVTSDDFKGEVGRSYHVEVELKAGERFASLPELMYPVPDIEKVAYRRDGLSMRFYADFTDNPEITNYYRWRYTGTYEVLAPVANEKCWTKDYDHEYLYVDKDMLYNGKSMKDILIYSLELDNRFNYGYDLQVHLNSITKSAYKYFTEIHTQIGNNGTIFETNNYYIQGNLYSVDNPEAKVLGYFQVSAISSKRIFVPDYMHTFPEINCEPNEIGTVPLRCLDCTQWPGNSSRTKPSWWPN